MTTTLTYEEPVYDYPKGMYEQGTLLSYDRTVYTIDGTSKTCRREELNPDRVLQWTTESRTEYVPAESGHYVRYWTRGGSEQAFAPHRPLVGRGAYVWGDDPELTIREMIADRHPHMPPLAAHDDRRRIP